MPDNRPPPASPPVSVSGRSSRIEDRIPKNEEPPPAREGYKPDDRPPPASAPASASAPVSVSVSVSERSTRIEDRRSKNEESPPAREGCMPDDRPPPASAPASTSAPDSWISYEFERSRNGEGQGHRDALGPRLVEWATESGSGRGSGRRAIVGHGPLPGGREFFILRSSIFDPG